MTDFQDLRNATDPSGVAEGSYYDTDTISSAGEAIQDVAQGNGIAGAFDTLGELGTEQDGFVVGTHNSEVRAGFQEETNVQVLDEDGNLTSSSSLTYGAYVEADGDVALGVTREGFEAYENGSLTYGAALDVATDGITGSAAAQRDWSMELEEGASGITGYAIAGGVSFEQPFGGGSTQWNAAVLGEVTYSNDMLQQFGTYAFVEGGIAANPSGMDAVARAGLGKETQFGDLRAGVDQSGGIGLTIGTSF